MTSDGAAPTIRKLALDLKKNQDQVRHWRKRWRGARTPPEMCCEIERLSGGAVRCEDERNDLNWVRVRDKTWPGGKGRPVLDVTRIAA